MVLFCLCWNDGIRLAYSFLLSVCCAVEDGGFETMMDTERLAEMGAASFI